MSAKYIGDRPCKYCIICQDYHEDGNPNNEGPIQCDIDLHEISPLARLCIEARATTLSGKDVAATADHSQAPKELGSHPQAKTAVTTPDDRPGSSAKTALDVQRDNTIIALQVQVKNLENKLATEFERKLALQMQDLKHALGLEQKDGNPSKSTQTNQLAL